MRVLRVEHLESFIHLETTSHGGYRWIFTCSVLYYDTVVDEPPPPPAEPPVRDASTQTD